MNKNLFSKIIETPAIDSGFLTLWTSQAGNSVIADYIRNNYFAIAYGFAATILKNRVTRDNLEEEAANLALDVMSDIIKAAETGTLKFTGKSSTFSTYIFAALKFKRSGKNKFYYPSEVKRKGLPAMDVYHYIFVEKYSDSEIISHIKGSFQISDEKIKEYINLACSFNEKEWNRTAAKKMTSIESYDHLLDVAPHKEQGNTLTPQGEFFKQHDLKLLNNALSSLNKLESTIIKGYFLEGRWKNIKEMQTELKLKNGVYELKKVKEKLRETLNVDIIFE